MVMSNTTLQKWSYESNTTLKKWSYESNTTLQKWSYESNTTLQKWSYESNTTLKKWSYESNTRLHCRNGLINHKIHWNNIHRLLQSDQCTPCEQKAALADPLSPRSFSYTLFTALFLITFFITSCQKPVSETSIFSHGAVAEVLVAPADDHLQPSLFVALSAALHHLGRLIIASMMFALIDKRNRCSSRRSTALPSPFPPSSLQ